MQINIYTIALFLSALVSGGVGLYVWRRRSVTGGRELAMLMFAVAYWGLFQSLEASGTSHFAKLFWTAVSYPGIMSVPVLLLIFTLRYAQLDEWLENPWIALLWVIPLVSVVLAATSGLQHILWTQVTLRQTAVGIVAIYGHGLWSWISVIYSYTLVGLGLIILARAAFRLPNPFAWQARLALTAGLVPLAAHLIYVLSPASIGGLDITPITFTATGVLVAAALLRYRMLDLRPIASSVLYEGIRDALVAVDQENRIVDVNGPACEIIGQPAGNILGRPAPEVLAGIPSLVERLASGDLPCQGEIPLEEDGEPRHYNLRIWPLLDRRERPLGKLVTLHDVTELKRVQDELERINAELDGYAHTVSHDLKGPLTSIMLANQALVRLMESPETPETRDKVEKVLGLMFSSTEKANSHINCLLALAVAGQKPTAVQEVDVGDIVGLVLEEHRGDIEDHRAKVITEDLGSLRADPTHIYQLFSNLIGNCFQHNAGLDIVIEVRRLAGDAGGHRFLVRDNGQGINEADLERIFEPFYKADGNGSGIGLATARRIVRVYGGDIYAYNDHGACFEFSLPDWPEEETLRTVAADLSA